MPKARETRAEGWLRSAHQRRGAGDDTVTASAAAGGAIPSAFRRRQASKFRSLFNFPADFRWALLHTCS